MAVSTDGASIAAAKVAPGTFSIYNLGTECCPSYARTTLCFLFFIIRFLIFYCIFLIFFFSSSELFSFVRSYAVFVIYLYLNDFCNVSPLHGNSRIFVNSRVL